MRYTEEIQVAAQPQPLKSTKVAVKHHPTRIEESDIIDWSVARPIRRKGTIVERTVIGVREKKNPSRIDKE
jgi:hypothetical protein